MLEILIIIWLSLGFVISLTTFFLTMYKTDYMQITLEDLFALIVIMFTGPIAGLYFLIEKFVHLDGIILFKHHRRQQ